MKILINSIMDTSKLIFLLGIIFIDVKYYLCAVYVETAQGAISGERVKTSDGSIFSSFYNIPYAQPPLGNLRFRNPVPPNPWRGIRQSTQNKDFCPQRKHNRLMGNEDCLYLDVYTPASIASLYSRNRTQKTNRLSVMVWIHGGAFMRGSKTLNKNTVANFMKRNVLLVSLNYRLGMLGFFTTGDEEAPGNFGLKDQVLALKWVQKNIHAFGGNPRRVTIFGSSAGGASVNFLALSDSANDLFQQYIIQSGSVLSPWVYRDRREYRSQVEKYAMKLHCLSRNSSTLVDCLRKKKASELLLTSLDLLYVFPDIPWVPTNEVESKEAFLCDSPRNLISRGKLKDLPSITGTNADEGLIITLPFYIKSADKSLPANVIRNIMLLSEFYTGPASVKRFTSMIDRFYFSNKTTTKKEFLDQYTKFLSDGIFNYPQMNLMGRANANSYNYLFNYRKEPNGRNRFGVNHGAESVYLLQLIFKETIDRTDRYIIDVMVDLWTSFASSGKPRSNLLPIPGIWVPSKGREILHIHNFRNSSKPLFTLSNDYFNERMSFWRMNYPLVRRIFP